MNYNPSLNKFLDIEHVPSLNSNDFQDILSQFDFQKKIFDSKEIKQPVWNHLHSKLKKKSESNDFNQFIFIKPSDYANATNSVFFKDVKKKLVSLDFDSKEKKFFE
jgi:hypothetical protein